MAMAKPKFPRFWLKLTPKKKRLLTILTVFALSLLTLTIGSLMPLNHQYATAVSDALNTTLITEIDKGSLTQYIFTNNLAITLLMFIPVVGPTAGTIIIFKSGIALNAIVAAYNLPITAGYISQASTPVFWIEFTVYAVAMAESLWLYRRLRQHKLRAELKNTLLLIGVCGLLLFVSTILEVYLINS
jgi:hypothetical protein